MKPAVIMRWIFALGIFLLVLPIAMRFMNEKPLMPGSEGYGHARIAELIAEKGIPAYDPAIPERAYSVNIFDLSLAGFVKVLGTDIASVVLPLLLGLLSMLCMLKTLKNWKVPIQTSLCIMLVFVLSPLFVNVFTQSIPESLELFLIALFLLLLSPPEKARTAKSTIFIAVCAAAVAVAVASFGIIPAIIAFALPMILRTLNKKVQAQMLFASLASFIMLIAFSLPRFLQQEPAVFAKHVPVVQAISDFGGSGGLSLFAWLLAIIGFVLLWQFKKKYYSAMICAGALLLTGLLSHSALVSAHILVAVLAGYALYFFVQMKWSFDDIRTLTVLVLVCGLLFSALSEGLSLARGEPSIATRYGAISLGALPEGSVILAYPDEAFWFEYWSGKQVLVDSWAPQTPRANERWALAQKIWHANDISQLKPLLYRNSISAIVVSKEMQNGLVWDMPEEGLLYLLQNSETFKNAHHSSSVDIWAVLPPKKQS
jgi:hypothetical protein